MERDARQVFVDTLDAWETARALLWERINEKLEERGETVLLPLDRKPIGLTLDEALAKFRLCIRRLELFCIDPPRTWLSVAGINAIPIENQATAEYELQTLFASKSAAHVDAGFWQREIVQAGKDHAERIRNWFKDAMKWAADQDNVAGPPDSTAKAVSAGGRGERFPDRKPPSMSSTTPCDPFGADPHPFNRISGRGEFPADLQAALNAALHCVQTVSSIACFFAWTENPQIQAVYWSDAARRNGTKMVRTLWETLTRCTLAIEKVEWEFVRKKGIRLGQLSASNAHRLALKYASDVCTQIFSSADWQGWTNCLTANATIDYQKIEVNFPAVCEHLHSLQLPKAERLQTGIEWEAKRAWDRRKAVSIDRPRGKHGTTETASDTVELMGGNLDKLPLSRKKAYQQYVEALERNPALDGGTDRDVYDWLKEELEDDERRTLPNVATWTKYLRVARRALNTSKYNSRARRTGRSIVKPDEI